MQALRGFSGEWQGSDVRNFVNTSGFVTDPVTLLVTFKVQSIFSGKVNMDGRYFVYFFLLFIFFLNNR